MFTYLQFKTSFKFLRVNPSVRDEDISTAALANVELTNFKKKKYE